MERALITTKQLAVGNNYWYSSQMAPSQKQSYYHHHANALTSEVCGYYTVKGILRTWSQMCLPAKPTAADCHNIS